MRSGSEIAELQNSEPMITMLKAQRRLYTEAKRVKAVAAAICLGIPIAVTGVQLMTSLALPSAEVCICAELVTFAVGIAFAASAEGKTVTAASVQQRFDLELYGLGSYDSASLRATVTEAAARYDKSRSANPSRLQGWYEDAISGLEPIEAIRCCQRTNLTWSLKLARLWLGILVVASMACIAFLALSAMSAGISMTNVFFGATIVEWLTLQLVDGASYFRRLRDLRIVADFFDVDSEAYVLRLQDQIFECRKSRFMVPDFVFRMMHGRYSSIGDEIAAAERL